MGALVTAPDSAGTLDRGPIELGGKGDDPHSLSQPAAGRYSGHWARLFVLLVAFGVAYALHALGSARPFLHFLILSSVILLCVALLMGPRNELRSARMAVPLFDLAWLTFAMHLSRGASVYLLPALYIVLATVALRRDNWGTSMALAGIVTAILLTVTAHQSGTALEVAVAQATLLAAGGVALRLTIGVTSPAVAERHDQRPSDILSEKTSDGVFTLTVDDWRIVEANPAGRALLDPLSDDDVRGRLLPEMLRFADDAFLKTCQEELAKGQPVVDVSTHAHDVADRKLLLRCNMEMVEQKSSVPLIRAIMQIVPDQNEAMATRAERDDFILNYIPTLTHELNNHLAGIRMSAEFAVATGRMPDFQQMQQQVDRCQDVLHTVTLQILRSAAPSCVPEKLPETNLRIALERSLLLTRPQVLSQGVHLQVDTPPDLPHVIGFTHELQEVLARVVLQSVERMTEQESARAIAITATARPTSVDLVITDTGPGLNSRELYILNGKQVAASRSEDRTWKTVRDAACRFGGDLQASNGLHGGVRLRLSLPIAEPQEVEA
jgi:nitrogen-specific signal transduction histidine kinase